MLTQRTPMQSLYVLKAVCAYLVVCIHCMPVGIEMIGLVVNMAVPCFFLMSGYMLYRGDVKQETALAIKRCRKVFCVAMLLHGACILLTYFNARHFCAWWVYLVSFVSGRGFFGHQWFLFALCQLYLLFAIVRQRIVFSIVSLVVMIAVNVGLGVVPDIVEYSVEFDLFWPRVLLCGIPYFATGYLMGRFEEIYRASKWVPYSAVAVVACWWWGVSHDNVWNIYGLNFLFLYAAACGSMLLCLRFKNASLPVLDRIGHYHSANIYYVHVFMTPLATRAMWHLFRLREMDLLPLFVFAISLFLSVLFTAFVRCVKKLISHRITPLPG